MKIFDGISQKLISDLSAFKLLFSLKKFKFFITWKSTNVFTAKNAQKYEKDVAMELPMPRYSRGKSSPISNQEIGEIPAKIIKLIRTRIQ